MIILLLIRQKARVDQSALILYRLIQNWSSAILNVCSLLELKHWGVGVEDLTLLPISHLVLYGARTRASPTSDLLHHLHLIA